VPWKNRRFFRVLEMRGQHLEINPTGYFRKRARPVRALLILLHFPFYLTNHSFDFGSRRASCCAPLLFTTKDLPARMARNLTQD